MRKIEYLSPSSVGMFYSNPNEFYLNYLSDNRPPRLPQTRPMSIGSSFDAYVKAYLHEKLFGKDKDPKYTFEALFEAQVEKHNREWAKVQGEIAFNIYKKSGALSDLMLVLTKSVGSPRFEFEVKGVINGVREGATMERQGVKLLGRPDVFFINEQGQHVILDWKVNGWCSNSAVSPMQGYVGLRDPDGSNKGAHKNAFLMQLNGILINAGSYLEQFNQDWARQLSTYGWLCGCEVGDEFITAIDQLACGPDGFGGVKVRIAQHRLRVNADYQRTVFENYCNAWDIIHSDHFFREMSKEESQQRCKLLDQQAEVLKGDGSVNDNWFSKVTREHYD